MFPALTAPALTLPHRNRLANVAMSLQRHGLARRALEAGLQVNAKHPGLLALLMETCLALHDVPSAEHAARQLLDAAPEHPRATEVMCVATLCRLLCSALRARHTPDPVCCVASAALERRQKQVRRRGDAAAVDEATDGDEDACEALQPRGMKRARVELSTDEDGAPPDSDATALSAPLPAVTLDVPSFTWTALAAALRKHMSDVLGSGTGAEAQLGAHSPALALCAPIRFALAQLVAPPPPPPPPPPPSAVCAAQPPEVEAVPPPAPAPLPPPAASLAPVPEQVEPPAVEAREAAVAADPAVGDGANETAVLSFPPPVDPADGVIQLVPPPPSADGQEQHAGGAATRGRGRGSRGSGRDRGRGGGRGDANPPGAAADARRTRRTADGPPSETATVLLAAQAALGDGSGAEALEESLAASNLGAIRKYLHLDNSSQGPADGGGAMVSVAAMPVVPAVADGQHPPAPNMGDAPPARADAAAFAQQVSSGANTGAYDVALGLLQRLAAAPHLRLHVSTCRAVRALTHMMRTWSGSSGHALGALPPRVLLFLAELEFDEFAQLCDDDDADAARLMAAQARALSAPPKTAGGRGSGKAGSAGKASADGPDLNPAAVRVRAAQRAEQKVAHHSEAGRYAALAAAELNAAGSDALPLRAEVLGLAARYHWLMGRMATVHDAASKLDVPACELGWQHFARCLSALDAGQALAESDSCPDGHDNGAADGQPWSIRLGALRHGSDLSAPAVRALSLRLQLRGLVLRCDAEIEAGNAEALLAEVAPHVLWPDTGRLDEPGSFLQKQPPPDREALHALHRACVASPDSQLVVTAQLRCCILLLTGPLAPQGPLSAATHWRNADTGARVVCDALRGAGAAVERALRWVKSHGGTPAPDATAPPQDAPPNARRMPALDAVAQDLGVVVTLHMAERAAVLRNIHSNGALPQKSAPLSEPSAGQAHAGCLNDAAEVAARVQQLAAAAASGEAGADVEAVVGLHEGLHGLCANAKACCGYFTRSPFLWSSLGRLMAAKADLARLEMDGAGAAAAGGPPPFQGPSPPDEPDDDVEPGSSSESDNDDGDLAQRLDELLAKFVFCAYGVTLSDLPPGHQCARVPGSADAASAAAEALSSPARCADLWRLLGPYATQLATRAAGKAGGGAAGRRLLHLRPVLETIRSHFPKPPPAVLARHGVDDYLDGALPSEEGARLGALTRLGDVNISFTQLPAADGANAQLASGSGDVRVAIPHAFVRASLYGLCATACGLWAASLFVRRDIRTLKKTAPQDWDQLRHILLAGLDEYRGWPRLPPSPAPAASPFASSGLLAWPSAQGAAVPGSAGGVAASTPAPAQADKRDFDKWADAHLQHISLLRMHLCYQPNSARTWRDLGEAYAALLAVCLDDAANRWGCALWTLDPALDAALAQYRTRVRRCLDAALVCAQQEGQQLSPEEVVSLHLASVTAAYDALRIMPPAHDLWRSAPSSATTDPTRRALTWACGERVAGAMKEKACKGHWQFPLFAGLVAYKQRLAPGDVLEPLARAVRLGPTVVEPRYKLHAARLKLVLHARAAAAAAPDDARAACAAAAAHAHLAENRAVIGGDGDVDAALLRQAGDAVAALADIVAAAKFCHKARRRLALGHLALVRPGVSPQAACYSAADALIFLFRKSEVGTFDWNIWLASDSHWNFGPKGKPHVTAGGSQAARGGGGRRGRGRGRGPARLSDAADAAGHPVLASQDGDAEMGVVAVGQRLKFSTVGYTESIPKFMAITRRCLLLLLPLLEVTGDLSTARAAAEHMRRDVTYGSSLTDVACAAQGVFVRTLLAELRGPRYVALSAMQPAAGAPSSQLQPQGLLSQGSAAALSERTLGTLRALPLPPVPSLVAPPPEATVIPLGRMRLPKAAWLLTQYELSLEDVVNCALTCTAMRGALAWYLRRARRRRACEAAFELYQSMCLVDASDAISWTAAVNAPVQAAAALPWHLLAPAVPAPPCCPRAQEYTLEAIKAHAWEYLSLVAAHGEWEELQGLCVELRKALHIRGAGTITSAVTLAKAPFRDAWHAVATSLSSALAVALAQKGVERGKTWPDLLKCLLTLHKEAAEHAQAPVPLRHTAALLWLAFAVVNPGAARAPGGAGITLGEVVATLETASKQALAPKTGAGKPTAPAAKPQRSSARRGSAAEGAVHEEQAVVVPLALQDASTLGEAPGAVMDEE